MSPRRIRRKTRHAGPPARPWRAALMAVTAIVLFFGLLEGLLAILGVQPGLRGEDPFVGFAGRVRVFVEERGDDARPVLSTAANKLRFFNPQRFPRDKAPGTYRIFCLGGSTTYGRPYDDATSFPGWLRELLPEADPGRRFEVINAGGISYASYRVARVMEELADYEPDLFIVYTGHNEFLEERTYGELRDVAGPVRAVSAVLARTRTWTAMRALLDRAGALPRAGGDGRFELPDEVSPVLERFEGLDAYERDDALRDGILQHYRVSLERMVGIARDAGAGLILVTPASNLADSAPFKSQHTDRLGDAERARSEALLAAARGFLREDHFEEALAALDEAIAIDPRFAALHYRRGRALLSLGRYEDAEKALKRARDEDVCPLRALSPMRGTLAEVARETGTPWLDFAGLIERRLEADRGYGIPGAETFLDHVHPTIEANRMLAVALIEVMIEQRVLQPSDGWGEEAIARVTAHVEGGLDRTANARAMANLAQVLFWAGKEEEARRPAAEALASGVEEASVVVTAARILGSLSAAQGDERAARGYFRTALHADPGNAETHFQVGLAYLNEPGRNLPLAAAHLFLTLALWPDNDMAHQTFGLAMAERGRYGLALASLREARRLNPDDPDLE